MEFLTVSLLTKIAIPIITSLVSVFVNKLNKSTDVKISREREAELRELAIDAIGYASEIAARSEKDGLGGKLSGEKKMIIAQRYIQDKKTVSDQEVNNLITSALAKIKGEGATGNRIIAP